MSVPLAAAAAVHIFVVELVVAVVVIVAAVAVVASRALLSLPVFDAVAFVVEPAALTSFVVVAFFVVPFAKFCFGE